MTRSAWFTDHGRPTMKLKSVLRRDRKLIRLGRAMWVRGRVGVPGGGHSSKVSLALYPRLFSWTRERNECWLYLLGFRVHWQRTLGGIHT